MHTSLRSLAPRPQARWSHLYSSVILAALASLLTLSASTALAQPYTYETIDPPTSRPMVFVTAVTNLGKLAGTAGTSDGLAPFQSWTWTPAEGFRLLSFKDKEIHVTDMNGSKRLVGTWRTQRGFDQPSGPRRPFTISSGRLTTLQLPPLVTVDTCTVNEAHDIVCTGMTAQEVIQAVRVKGSTPGVLQVYPVGVVIEGISAARDVVGWQFDPQDQKTRGYYREASTGEEVWIDAPCGADTEITDINAAGTLVTVQCGGGFDEGSAIERPLFSYLYNGEVWKEIRIDIHGAEWTRAARVNDTGQVVGTYRIDVPGDTEPSILGFIATPGGIGDSVAQD